MALWHPPQTQHLHAPMVKSSHLSSVLLLVFIYVTITMSQLPITLIATSKQVSSENLIYSYLSSVRKKKIEMALADQINCVLLGLLEDIFIVVFVNQ